MKKVIRIEKIIEIEEEFVKKTNKEGDCNQLKIYSST